MPQRTNDFQQVVALVQRALAPEGAIITESALVETSTEGETREIDVLIETQVGEYRIRVAIEVKDEGRPMDSTKFESIIGKYLVEGGIRVNKIVVITHHGFYQPVIERARKLDIDLLTLEEAKNIDWSCFRPPGPPFKCGLEICNVRLTSAIEDNESALRDGRVVCSCGRYYGTAQEFALFLFWDLAVRQCRDQLIAMDDDAAIHKTEKKVDVKVSGISGDHQRHLVYRGEHYRLEQISFDVHFRHREHEEFQPSIANIRFSLAPHICTIQLIPPIANVDAKEVAKSGRVVCSCCGKDHGTLFEWVRERTRNFLPSNPEAQRLLAEGVGKSPTGHAYLGFALSFCQKLCVVFEENMHLVQEVKVQIHAASATSPIECKQYELTRSDGRMKVLTHLEGTVAGKKVTILMPDGTQSKRVCLRIQDSEA